MKINNINLKYRFTSRESFIEHDTLDLYTVLPSLRSIAQNLNKTFIEFSGPPAGYQKISGKRVLDLWLKTSNSEKAICERFFVDVILYLDDKHFILQEDWF